MKSAIYRGKEAIEIVEIPLPKVGANDVLIQNLYSSICGTDVVVYSHGPGTGHKVDIGKEFGHETISRIVKIGSNISEFKIGQRVYPYPLFAKDDTKRALKWFGLEKVMLCDISDFRLSKAKAMGFDVCNTGLEDFIEKCKGLYGTAPSLDGISANIDIFLDAAGAESILKSFMKHGKIGSRFVSVAVNNAIRQLDLLHLSYAQKSIIGSGGYMPEDVRDVLNIMESGKFDMESIITHEFPLSTLSQAIQTAADTQHSFNVVINFSKKQGVYESI